MQASTDKKIECILYALAKKQEMNLDIEECVQVAKKELLAIWDKDFSELENDFRDIYNDYHLSQEMDKERK